MADPAIAPPPWKGIYFINHPLTNTGWSETHYFNTASLTTAQTSMASLITARMATLTNKYTCVYSRLSAMNVKGDGYIGTSTFPVVGTFTPAVADGGKPGDCLLLRYTDAAGHHNNRELRGIPEESITDGVYTPATLWLVNLTLLAAQITSTTSFRRKTAIAPFVEFVPIATVSSVRTITKKVGRPFGLSRGRAAIR